MSAIPSHGSFKKKFDRRHPDNDCYYFENKPNMYSTSSYPPYNDPLDFMMALRNKKNRS